MRKITAGLFISLDGVVEDPQDWHFPYFNDEMGAAVDRQLAAADTLLLGRKTYDSFAGAWPDREAAGEEDAAMGKALGDAAEDRRLEPESPVHLAQLRAAEGRPCRGRHRAEERAWRNGYRDERIHLNRPSAAGRRHFSTNCTCWSTRSRYARACGCSTRANPRSRLRLVSSQAFTTGVHVPHLRPGRIDSRGQVRGGESAPAPD